MPVKVVRINIGKVPVVRATDCLSYSVGGSVWAVGHGSRFDAMFNSYVGCKLSVDLLLICMEYDAPVEHEWSANNNRWFLRPRPTHRGWIRSIVYCLAVCS